ncbi:bifunctional diguanylate cyclase/phosphodiesterase [Halomonas korlensis]|uniref:PAS domain S-box-containing protein/diguanylate cyclase (GGDEF) domain-containing protein n=1 Tax=Halomonas korlensis TaxID=463301 RepID=A0A1I7GSS0_9GAMM|nr:EAL domain-containing protein [Halomonas korlensis]SFU51286.1 PAS domain S-box-containing protein/diguanylate cyclase (GGDEF) domain-containing protein [Halomonas korlensis]
MVTAEEAFRQLADGLGRSGADDFFKTLVQRLATLLRVDHVIIAEVVESDHAQTLAVWSGDKLRANFRYQLAGSPCERVVGHEACFFPGNVCGLFPDDTLLRALAVESYLGMPLYAVDGSPLGLLAVLHDQPMQFDRLAHEVLRIAATQAGAELGRRHAEQALTHSEAAARESERWLDALMHQLPGMVYRCHNDREWTMQFVSHGALVLTGYRPEALLGNQPTSYGRLIHPGDRDRVFDVVQDAVARHSPFRVIYRLASGDGTTRWVWEQGQAVYAATGEVEWLEGFIIDITEQHESQRIQQAVVQVATTVSTRLGDDYFHQLVRNLVEILEADAGFVATLDTTQEPATTLTTQSLMVDGQRLDNITYPIEGSKCAQVLAGQECMKAAGEAVSLPGDAPGRQPAQAWLGRRLDNVEGQPIGVMMVLYRRPLEDNNFPTSVLRILATGAAAELERRRDHQRMQQLAYRDMTTGLPNRISFVEVLAEWRARAERRQRPLAMLCLDVRRFKEINDTHGHQVGDQLLAMVARRFQGALGTGEFLARLAGDEFALLLADADEAAIADAMRRMPEALSSPIVLGHRSFTLEVSVGVAEYPRDALTPDDLFTAASIALFHAKQHAKQSGNGSSHFNDAMARDLHHRQRMTERLLAALKGDGLQLCYQPQFDLTTGELVGAEALCRWHDAEWGWVSPGEFIPLAEERGLIRPLGDWVLQEACRQLVAWRHSGLRLPGRLSINISAQQFDDPQLAGHIAGLIEDTEISSIALEITESDFMRDPEQAVDITRALRQAGFALSIDDFGTGYSSLAYLRRFAADALKIDISFVRDMLTSHHDRAIVDTIIAMARALGLRTVAEGVETREQAAALAELGCDQAQGYYFGRPVSGVAFFEQWGATVGRD